MPPALDDAEIARMLADGAVYQSVVVVRAARVSKDSNWTTPNGDTLTAKAGDWWVLEGDDRWTVAHDVFTRTYESLGEDRYRKFATVTAVCVDRPFSVHTTEGLATGKAGDWLVRNRTGECWPVTNTAFARRYAPAGGIRSPLDSREGT